MLLAIAAVACQNEPEIVPEVNVTSTSTTLPVAGTEDLSFKVTFKTNVDWTVALKEQVQWCTVTPAKGVAGDAAVTVIAEENETKEPREVTLVITAGTAKEEVKLTQLQVDAFELVKESDTVGAEGGTYDLKVMTNVEYSVVIPEDVDWVTVSKAYAEATTKLVVAPFETLDATRTAELTVKAAGLEDLTFTLVQEGPKSRLWGVDMRTVMNRVGTFSKDYTLWDGSVENQTYSTVVSMALYDGKLVVCAGDGTKPVVLNKETGEKIGELETGDVIPSTITNDDAGNLVFSSRVYNWWVSGIDFAVWYMKPGEKTPVKLVSCADQGYANGPSYVGARLSARGDVTKNGVVASPWEGAAGNGENMVLAWEIKDGVAGSFVKQTLTGFDGMLANYGAPGYWSAAPNNYPGYALAGTELAHGAAMIVYPENVLHVVGADCACTPATEMLPNAEYAGNYNPSAVDIRNIGGKNYVAVGLSPWWPEYGSTPIVLVADVADMTIVGQPAAGTYAPTGEVSDTGAPYYETTAGANTSACLVMEGTEEGIIVYHVNNACSGVEALMVYL